MIPELPDETNKGYYISFTMSNLSDSGFETECNNYTVNKIQEKEEKDE